MDKINDRLKKARTDSHLSQEYVARFLGINRSAVVEMNYHSHAVTSSSYGNGI